MFKTIGLGTGLSLAGTIVYLYFRMIHGQMHGPAHGFGEIKFHLMNPF